MPAFKLMTWNVENLFLPSHEDGPDTQAAFDQKLASLAALIDQERPDVLALQEVGPDGVLGLLKNALAHPMPHEVIGLHDERGIRVAFLSTVAFQSSRNIKAFPGQVRPIQTKDPILDDPLTPLVDESLSASMGRGGLEATIVFGGRTITIITAHFKSKLITYARKVDVVGGNAHQPNDEGERYRYAAYALFRRTGEALTIRHRLNEVLSDPQNPMIGMGRTKAVVFCGDLNDEPAAATTQIIQGPSGSEVGTGGFAANDQGDGFRMWNLAPLFPNVAGEPAFTRRYKGRGEIIDHIFASHALVNPANTPSARTVMFPDPLPSMGDDPNARRNEPGSDHAAVVAVFQV